jgi:hypothetical protein
MIGTILLNHTENTKKVEEEEMTRFLRSVLEEMGVPVQDFWTTDAPLTVEQKIKLRGIFTAYGIQVIDDLDGNMRIYVSADGETQKVAEWFKSTYKLKRDLKQLDPRKQLYLEMNIHCWSLFEETRQREQS